MTNEEVIEILDILSAEYYPNALEKEALDMAIKALEQQPCDCISRAKALEMLGDEPENWTDTENEIQEVNDYRWFKSILEELPPVTPQQKIGKWIKDCGEVKCSCCGYYIDDDYYAKAYCTNCGAYMREAKE